MPYSPLFFNILLLGVLLAMSSTSWVSVWATLELQSTAFIAYTAHTLSLTQQETVFKFFLMQGLSSLILFSTSLAALFPTQSITTLSSLLLMTAFLLKMGLPPFHFWYINSVPFFAWKHLITLLTILKVAPLSLFFLITKPSMLTYTLILFTAAISSLGIMNSASLSMLFIFSSFSHTAWMWAISLTSSAQAMMYLLLYLAILSPTLLAMNITSAYSLTLSTLFSPPHTSLQATFSLLNLGGLPPLAGFSLKWLATSLLISYQAYALLLGLLASSLANLYSYTTLCISLLSHSTKQHMRMDTLFSATLALVLFMAVTFSLSH